MATFFCFIDSKLRNCRPSTIVCGTTISVIVFYKCFVVVAKGQLWMRFKTKLAQLWRFFLTAPIQKGIEDAVDEVCFLRVQSSEKLFREIPAVGLSVNDVYQKAFEMHQQLDADFSTSKDVCWGSEGFSLLLQRMACLFLWNNSASPELFGATRRMEAELGSMMVSLFRGPSGACATFTSSGTESIFVCLLAYRNKAQSCGIAHPEIIVPSTAHPAFDKIGHMLGIRVLRANCSPSSFLVDSCEVERLIGKSTVALVGSAPNLPYGCVDDIPTLSEIAQKYSIDLHVDACFGGFLIQFKPDAGFSSTTIDFRLQGVTSIACNLHTWGGTPKGASFALFRSRSLRHYSLVAVADNPGGLYVSPSLCESRPGHAVAFAWGTLLASGKTTYINVCRKIISASLNLRSLLIELPEVELLGDCQCGIIPFTSRQVDVYSLREAMKGKGWELRALQFPPAVQLQMTIYYSQPEVISAFVSDLRECIATLRDETKLSLSNHCDLSLGSTQHIGDRSVVEDFLKLYDDRIHSGD